MPARVYWVRRGVVLALLVAVLVLLVLGVKALTGGGGEPAASATEPVSPASVTESAAADTGTPTCDAASLGITLTADATSYAADAQPLLTVTLVNNGTQSCLVDAGEAQRSIVITSGSDRIWASTDCLAADTASLDLLLSPGQSDERQTQWDRNRSAESCPGDQSAALAGTYQAVLTFAGVTTDPVVFTLE
ncbi:MAG TPA: hypothetical protein VGC67_12015 [Cellulomonas sp.]